MLFFFFLVNFTSLSFLPPFIPRRKVKGWGRGTDLLSSAIKITSSEFVPPAFLLRAWRPSQARPARPVHPPDSPGLPEPPELRPAMGRPCVPSRDTTWSLGRVQMAGAHPLSPGPARRPRSSPGGPRSSRRLSFASRAKPGLRAVTGPGGEGTCPARENARARKSLLPPPRRELAGEAGERKTSPRQGRPGVSHKTATCAAAPDWGRGPGGERGPGTADAPARPGATLTREPAAPLAVPAAPLQDEVAAALLSHPELQGVLQQHLLGLEPHRGGPAAPAGPGSHRPGRRAEPAREEEEAAAAAVGSAASRRPALGSPKSAAGAARPSRPAQPARRPRPGPAHGSPRPAHRPRPAHPAGSRGAARVSESRRLQRSSGVEGGSPIPAAGLPASPPALAGGAAAPLLSSAPAGRQPGEQQEEEEAMVKKTSCCPSCRLPT